MEHHGHDMHHGMHSPNHSTMPKHLGMDGKDMPDMDMDMDHSMMKMFFHFGINETVLFEQWKFTTVGGLIGSMIGILIMAALYEGLKYYREYLFWKTYNALQYRAVSIPEKGVVNEENQIVHMVGEVIHKQPPTMWSKMHSFQTFLHMIQMVLSYFLMLIFMTYNIWLCIAVVIGAGIGYFLFGWKKSVIVDVTEHCH
ncbi:high affinity copper uptake protein 1 isoform X2 [Harmonia axyridis]|nr:high affinity copper uptake protein 1 isoform X2 [Harmonia axyridis]XP_045466259.1 high affinity copper uptake protein 1 isoform X2 [Harmonia axyridis]XP_045466260.1 high affinity copper uptake protein 1 isoform X2 [Harmonia axyridis]XP_045466261.1 high affinity copper uptake protein 1 isoform X2 [Harmonia axyridis]